MLDVQWRGSTTIYHHIGGLEILQEDPTEEQQIYHHIGGLEITRRTPTAKRIIYHHIGGLEK